MFFIVQFVDVVYHIDWFADVEKSLHSWDDPTWSWCKIFLMYRWIQIAQYFAEDFYIYVHHCYWPVIFFFVLSLSGFGVRVMVASLNEFGSFPFYSFLEQFQKDQC